MKLMKLNSDQMRMLFEASKAPKGKIRCSGTGNFRKPYKYGSFTGIIHSTTAGSYLERAGYMKSGKSGWWGTEYQITDKGKEYLGKI